MFDTHCHIFLEDYPDIDAVIKKMDDPQKMKALGFEYGLNPEADFTEIIIGLQKIKKMELIINLSKDIDGNEMPDIVQINDKEISKIQRILTSMNENINNKNNMNYYKIINDSQKNNLEDKMILNNSDEEKVKNTTSNNNDDFYNDIDGEPL